MVQTPHKIEKEIKGLKNITQILRNRTSSLGRSNKQEREWKTKHG